MSAIVWMRRDSVTNQERRIAHAFAGAAGLCAEARTATGTPSRIHPFRPRLAFVLAERDSSGVLLGRRFAICVKRVKAAAATDVSRDAFPVQHAPRSS